MNHAAITLAVTSLLLANAAQAQAPGVAAGTPQTETPYSARKWPAGSSVRGTRGIHRVEAGVPMPAGSLVLSLGAQYFSTTDFLADGDTNERNAQQLTFVWSPVELLSISLSQSTVSNKNDRATPRTTQSLGDPALGVKVATMLSSDLGVGVKVVATIPTSAGGTGLDASGLVLNMRGLASYLPLPWLALSANAGYQVDNSRKIFRRGVDQLTEAQRFTANIATVNQIVYGVGADTHLGNPDDFSWGPFAELSGGFGAGAEMSESPMIASLGARVHPFGKDDLEILAGADLRLSGAPSRTSNKLPGVPPWELFAGLVAHLGGGDDVTYVQTSSSVTSRCVANAECAEGQQCIDGVCAVVKEIVRVETKEVARPEASFVCEGSVVDQSTGDPITSATLTFSGFDGSSLATDRYGKFRSWPIPAGEGLLKVTVSAPGYRSTEQTLPRTGGEELKALAFKIQSLGEDATGEIKGSLKDGRSGKPISGEVFIPVLGKKVRTDKDGNFQATMKAGRYQVLISSGKYVTQKKEIEIRAGDVVILNVDMVAKR